MGYQQKGEKRMNCVALCGRLTKDPAIKESKDTKVARFTLAVDRKYKKNEADFINCVAFGKTADVFENYVTKGMKIAVEGRWQTGSYTKEDGTKVYTNDCIVESMEFCESKNGGGKKEVEDDDDDFIIPDFSDEEVPFVNPK